MNDMLVKSIKAAEHLTHLDEMFSILKRHKPSKVHIQSIIWEVSGFHGKPARNQGQPRKDQSNHGDEYVHSLSFQ